MTASRLLPAFAISALLIVPALGQPAAKPPSLTARVEALEKENAVAARRCEPPAVAC